MMVVGLDFGSQLQGFNQALSAMVPYVKLYGTVIGLGVLVLINKYVVEGLKMLVYRNLYGMGKHVIACNDHKTRIFWCNLNEDVIVRKIGKTNTSRAFVNDHSKIYLDECGNRCLYFTQDFTEAVEFKPYKKYVYQDRLTKEILKDKDGNYASHINILQIVKDKYVKVLSPDLRNVIDFVQPRIIDNVGPRIDKVSDEKDEVVKKIIGILYPQNLLDSKKGIDSTLTGDVIIRKWKADSMQSVASFWKYMQIGGIVAIGLLVVIAVMVYNQGQALDWLKVQASIIKDYVSGVVIQ